MILCNHCDFSHRNALEDRTFPTLSVIWTAESFFLPYLKDLGKKQVMGSSSCHVKLGDLKM
jgi:hypothetical protein